MRSARSTIAARSGRSSPSASGTVCAIAMRSSRPARAARAPSKDRLRACISSATARSEEHTSELQSRLHLVCRLLLEKKKKKETTQHYEQMHDQKERTEQ